MSDKVLVIVFGTGSCALGQIRCAHDAGYDCINVVGKTPNRFSGNSKYCKKVVAPNPFKEEQKCVEFTLSMIKSLGRKPYLFFADDEWMMLIGSHERAFEEIAVIMQPHWEGLVQLFDKKNLYELAGKCDVPHPKTLNLDTIKGLDEYLKGITLPCIIKPQLTVSQNELASKKIKAFHRTQKFETAEAAVEWAEGLLSNEIDFPVVLQEFIPGDATSLYTLTSYSDKEGNLVAGSIGYKLRQFPPDAGRITSGVLHYDEKLHYYAEKFLNAVKFNGIANTEFKYDARDGEFKLMEINARFGAWNYSTLYSGINLMKIAVDDYNGIKYDGPTFKKDKDGHIWYNFAQDFGCSVILNKREEFKKNRLTVSQWRKSLGKNHFEGIWDWKDPMPFLSYVWYLFVDKVKGNSIA